MITVALVSAAAGVDVVGGGGGGGGGDKPCVCPGGAALVTHDIARSEYESQPGCAVITGYHLGCETHKFSGNTQHLGPHTYRPGQITRLGDGGSSGTTLFNDLKRNGSSCFLCLSDRCRGGWIPSRETGLPQ